MDPKDVLFLFDLMNLTSGLSIFLAKKNKLYFAVNLLFLLFSFSCSLYDIFIPFDSIDTEFWFLGRIIYRTGNILYTVAIYVLGDKIYLVFKIYFHLMNQKQISVIKRISIISMVFIAINMIGVSFDIKSFELSFLWFYILFSKLIIDYTTHGLFLMILLSLSSFYCHKRCLNNMRSKLFKKRNIDVKMHLKTMVFITNSIKIINSIFGPISLIVLSFLYVCPAYFIMIIKYNMTHWFYDIYFVVSVFSFVLLLIVLVESCNSALNSIRMDIIYLLQLQHQPLTLNHNLSFLMDLLQRENLFTLTAMDMFNLDYNMLLCFAGSLISISVFFCQILLLSNSS